LGVEVEHKPRIIDVGDSRPLKIEAEQLRALVFGKGKDGLASRDGFSEGLQVARQIVGKGDNGLLAGLLVTGLDTNRCGRGSPVERFRPDGSKFVVA